MAHGAIEQCGLKIYSGDHLVNPIAPNSIYFYQFEIVMCLELQDVPVVMAW